MNEFNAFGHLRSRVIENAGIGYNRDDVLDAIVELTADTGHFTDYELDLIADRFYEIRSRL